MSELRDRLEALAARGTHRGADDVLGAAQRDAQAAGRVADANGDDLAVGDLPFADDDELPVVSLEPRSGRRRFGSLIAAAGVAALVGVGALAVTAMLGSGGGASSPDGAVRQLADAITNKDPLAAVDVLVPTEVRSMRQTVQDATQRAADLKIVDDAGQPLAGVNLSVDNLQLTTEPLADGFAKVTIASGDISASTHREQMSALLQKAFHGASGGTQGQADLSKLAASHDLPTFVVVERVSGRWYVSPAYTVLEYVREVKNDPPADFGSANAADLGSATPDGAVSDALHAVQAGNWDRLLALAPPDELPVYDYRAMLDKELTAGEAPNFTIDNLTTTPSVSGDTGTVQVTASGTFGTGKEKWQVGGTCPDPSTAARLGSTSSSKSATSETFTGSGSASGVLGTTPITDAGGFVIGSSSTGSADITPNSSWCYSGSGVDALPLGLLLEPLSAGGSTGTVSISVVREDGRWFVSPVTTVLSVLDAGIQHIDQRTVDSLLGVAYELPPDGTITLDQPFQTPASATAWSSRVYAFDGKAGQQLVGQFDSTPQDQAEPLAFGFVYTADGQSVGEVDFSSLPTKPDDFVYASTAKLPSTGSYRLVLNDVGPAAGNTDATLTLWDLSDAPKALQNIVASNGDSGDTCTSSGPGLLGGGEICSSYSSSTPTTSFSYPSSSSSSSSNSSSTCMVTNGTLFCGGASVGKVCPPGVSPSASNVCLDPSSVKRFEQLQGQIVSGGVSGGGAIVTPLGPSAASSEATTTSP